MLKIGDFARLSRLSIKTLRFYDAAGLFRPAWVDPGSGYRFYRPEQTVELFRVRRLLELGFTVAETREFLGSSAHAPEVSAGSFSDDREPIRDVRQLRRLAMLRHRLMLRVARDERRLREIDLLSDNADSLVAADVAITVRSMPSIAVLATRDRVRSPETRIHRMFEATESLAARLGCRVASSPFLLIHDMEYRDAPLDVEVCVPVDPAAVGACGVRTVRAAKRVACLRFLGHYGQAPRLYQSMLEWMQRERLRICGPVRETYLRFGADQHGYTLPPRFLVRSAAEYLTELQIPVASIPEG